MLENSIRSGKAGFEDGLQREVIQAARALLFRVQTGRCSANRNRPHLAPPAGAGPANLDFVPRLRLGLPSFARCAGLTARVVMPFSSHLKENRQL